MKVNDLITEEQVIAKFSRVNSLLQVTIFNSWLEKNIFNMDSDVYDVAYKAIGHKEMELRDELLSRLSRD